MDGDDGVIGVMLAAEHALQLGHGDMLFQPGQTCGDLRLGIGIIFLHGHIQEEFGLFQLRPFVLPGDNDILEHAVFLLHLLGPVRIIPEFRGQGLPLQALKLVFFPV